jgi:hypothetical protein
MAWRPIGDYVRRYEWRCGCGCINEEGERYCWSCDHDQDGEPKQKEEER